MNSLNNIHWFRRRGLKIYHLHRQGYRDEGFNPYDTLCGKIRSSAGEWDISYGYCQIPDKIQKQCCSKCRVIAGCLETMSELSE